MLNRFRFGNFAGFITSSNWLAVFDWNSSSLRRLNVASMLSIKGGIHMTIVVKKVPKFLRGFVKLIFRIKE